MRGGSREQTCERSSACLLSAPSPHAAVGRGHRSGIVGVMDELGHGDAAEKLCAEVAAAQEARPPGPSPHSFMRPALPWPTCRHAKPTCIGVLREPLPPKAADHASFRNQCCASLVAMSWQ